MKIKTAHKQNRFLNCLRIQIMPGHYEEERIRSIVDFCKKYAFDNVILILNQEEYNVGHITKEEAKPWVDVMKRAKAALAEEGITVSLNNWMELGHVAVGRSLREGENYTTMVDFEGKKNSLIACPVDENWQTYFLDYYEYLLRELEPEVAWIEDDFRLHNHANEWESPFVGCFCEQHMQAYNKELGTNYTRDEFVDLLYRKSPEKRVQEAFLNVSRRCMVELAEKIGRMVKELGLGTKVALMSSAHTMHSMEARDWEGIYQALSQGGPYINRPWQPMYEEKESIREYFRGGCLLKKASPAPSSKTFMEGGLFLCEHSRSS